ncbi:Ger(x)C family spore germination protein [Halobacillus kuroshimensis]|uniref:Ger(x)C family spore germination protein n=1 Tax=Halobacillus kuroshimensis TaxID=302481 RepID=UPI00041B0F6C|nr:Ger(x)C family spore germination protein [Halobacillus kuroshimensis]
MKEIRLRLLLILLIFMGALFISYIQTTRLHTLSLVTGMGIEKEEGIYSVTLQIYNPEANAKESSSEIGGKTYTAAGVTIADAIAALRNDISKRIFTETLQIVVLGEQMVKEEGVDPVLDYLVRAPEIPGNIQMVIARESSPEFVFQMFPADDKVTSSHIRKLLSHSEQRWGTFQDISAERIKSLLEDKTSDIVIPYLELKGDKMEGLSKTSTETFTPAAYFSLTGLALLSNGRLKTYFTSEESRLLALLRGVNQKESLTFPCKDDNRYMTIRTTNTNASTKASVDPLSFNIQVHVKAYVEEYGCKEEMNGQRGIQELEEWLEETIKKELTVMVQKQEEEGADFLGLKDHLYRHSPAYWKKMKKEKNEDLSKVPVTIDVQAVLTKIGKTSKLPL